MLGYVRFPQNDFPNLELSVQLPGSSSRKLFITINSGAAIFCCIMLQGKYFLDRGLSSISKLSTQTPVLPEPQKCQISADIHHCTLARII